MGQADPQQTPSEGRRLLSVPLAPVVSLDDARCALCGASLVGPGRRYHMVSPLVSMGSVTVCRVCHRAALGEGYRPAD